MYLKLEKLAASSTAKVYKVLRKSDNTIFVKKKIKLKDGNSVQVAYDEI